MARSLASTDVPRPEELELRILLGGLEARLENFLDQRLNEMVDQQAKLHDQLLGKLHLASSARGPKRVADRSESQSSLWPYSGSERGPSHQGRKIVAPSLAELESAMMPDLAGICRMQSRSGDIPSARGSASISSVLPCVAKVDPAMLPGSTGETQHDPPGRRSVELEVDDMAEEAPDQEGKRSVANKLTHATDKGADMQDLLRNSQAFILVDCQPNRSASEVEVGQKDVKPYFTSIILKMPKAAFFLIAFLTFCQVTTKSSLLATGVMTSSRGLSFNIASSAIYGLVSICCVCLLKRALKSEQLKLSLERLHEFVADFEVNWHEVSGKEWRKFAMAWLASVLCFTVSQGLECVRTEDTSAEEVQRDGLMKVVMISLKGLSVINFAIASAIIMIVAYIQSHLLIGLDKSLDCWCSEIWNHQNFALGVQSWNAMQALLKFVGRELQNSFLVLQVFGYLGFLLFLGGAVAVAFRSEFFFFPMLVEVLAVLPLMILFLVNLRVFSHAAGLTEKCRAIPAFVNQIMAEEAVELNRQYLVQFIKDSSAGFYVKNVQLTQEMFAKQIYICGTVLSGLLGLISRVLFT
ncbi:unnamed protein product [Symbiodinium natans]|uniref:Uncharacterized protein n=1 Tax=Symbiodinium natans TaxID=878477 RepID=A0A812PC80_9DINO|nr:unnamed protein product [Symbiodinium natans]